MKKKALLAFLIVSVSIFLNDDCMDPRQPNEHRLKEVRDMGSVERYGLSGEEDSPKTPKCNIENRPKDNAKLYDDYWDYEKWVSKR